MRLIQQDYQSITTRLFEDSSSSRRVDNERTGCE